MNSHMVHTVITVCLSTLGSSILEVHWEGLVMRIALDSDITYLCLDELRPHTDELSHGTLSNNCLSRYIGLFYTGGALGGSGNENSTGR